MAKSPTPTQLRKQVADQAEEILGLRQQVDAHKTQAAASQRRERILTSMLNAALDAGSQP